MDISDSVTVIPNVGLKDCTFLILKQRKQSFTACSLFTRHCARDRRFGEEKDKHDSWSYGAWEQWKTESSSNNNKSQTNI